LFLNIFKTFSSESEGNAVLLKENILDLFIGNRETKGKQIVIWEDITVELQYLPMKVVSQEHRAHPNETGSTLAGSTYSVLGCKFFLMPLFC
jgi:hypothetical protein